MNETIRVGRRRVEITHPDKALFSEPTDHQARHSPGTTSSWLR